MLTLLLYAYKVETYCNIILCSRLLNKEAEYGHVPKFGLFALSSNVKTNCNTTDLAFLYQKGRGTDTILLL